MTQRSLFHYIALSCIALATLGGCAMSPAETPKEPVLTYSPVNHDVFYPSHTAVASRAEENALREFLDKNAKNPGGNIGLMVATPGEAKTEERIGDLRRLLNTWGYSDVLVVKDSNVPAERIRVSSSTITATAPDCPDWSYGDMANYRNSVMSNFGCAHATNLVRMVEDPNDLIAGSGRSGADAERSSGVIEAYREPPAPPQSTGGVSMTGGM